MSNEYGIRLKAHTLFVGRVSYFSKISKVCVSYAWPIYIQEQKLLSWCRACTLHNHTHPWSVTGCKWTFTLWFRYSRPSVGSIWSTTRRNLTFTPWFTYSYPLVGSIWSTTGCKWKLTPFFMPYHLGPTNNILNVVDIRVLKTMLW